MSATAHYQHLLLTWQERPSPTLGAALADGYRKQQRLDEAESLARQCTSRWEDYLPGYLVLARTLVDRRQWQEAEQVLRRALELEPSHPLVFSLLAEVAEATGHGGDALAWRQLREAAAVTEPAPLLDFLAGPANPGESPDWKQVAFSSDLEPDLGEELLSESLAALYQSQGHLERALEVYDSLAEREPDKASLVERRERLRSEIARQRPRPYHAEESGGESVGAWLGRIASCLPGARKEAGYDAFFQAPASRELPEDFEAFQQWLKGLG